MNRRRKAVAAATALKGGLRRIRLRSSTPNEAFGCGSAALRYPLLSNAGMMSGIHTGLGDC
jgi:hypothetical protein